MGRLLRLVVIFLALLLALAALAAAFGLSQALPVAIGAGCALLVLAGLRFRGNGPGFTHAERRRIFGGPWGG
jgi:hypothetical protein